MTVLISAVLPIALVAIVGFCVGRCFTLDLPTLAKINLYAMLPALVLTSLAKTTVAIHEAIAIFAAVILNMAFLYLLVISLSRSLQLPSDGHKSLIATTLFANIGNMGLPFILFALGEAGLERALVYLISSSLIIASVFPIMLKGAGFQAGLRYTVQLPTFWAALGGIGLQLSGQALPAVILTGLTLLGSGVIPLSLVILGIQLSKTEFIVGRYELLGTGLRLVVSPLSATGIGMLLDLSGLDLQVVVLQAAMPAAVNSLIWVTELGGDKVRVARTIMVSTLLSLLTLPIVLWLI